MSRFPPLETAEPRRTVTLPVGITLAEANRRLIFATLEYAGGVKKVAAALLGVSVKTLYNRLEEYKRNTPAATEAAASGTAPTRSDAGPPALPGRPLPRD